MGEKRSKCFGRNAVRAFLVQAIRTDRRSSRAWHQSCE